MKNNYHYSSSGVLSFTFGILVLSRLSDVQDKLGEAVDIDDGKIDRINEGKLVIPAERLEPELSFVDPATGLSETRTWTTALQKRDPHRRKLPEPGSY